MDNSLTRSMVYLNYSDQELQIFTEKTGKTPEEFEEEVLELISFNLDVLKYRLYDCTVSIADDVCFFGYNSAQNHFRRDVAGILDDQSRMLKKHGWNIVTWYRKS